MKQIKQKGYTTMYEIFHSTNLLTKENVKHILEDLVDKRVKNRYELQKQLSETFGCKIKLSQSWKNAELDEYDFSMVGHFENDNVFCYFDIYYTKSKTHYLITEVGYEFE